MNEPNQVLVLLSVGECMAAEYKEEDNSLLGYVETELGWVEASGIGIKEISSLNSDSDDPHEKYRCYLASWLFESHPDSEPSPMSFDQWLATAAR